MDVDTAKITYGDKVVIPRGDDTIASGDTVIVLTTTSARSSVAKLFKPRAL